MAPFRFAPTAPRSALSRCVWRERTCLFRPRRGPLRAAGANRHSAYRSNTVTIHYPWHPLHGKRVRLVSRTARDGVDVVHLETRNGLSRELPAWMCDEAHCATLSRGAAQVSVEALIELRGVLSTVDLRAELSSKSSTKEDATNEAESEQKSAAGGAVSKRESRAREGGGNARARARARRSDDRSTRARASRGGGR